MAGTKKKAPPAAGEAPDAAPAKKKAASPGKKSASPGKEASPGSAGAKRKRPAVVLRKADGDATAVGVVAATASAAAEERQRVKRLRVESENIEKKILDDARKDAELKLKNAERRIAAKTYLIEWRTRGENDWRFNKKLQTWWVQRCLDVDLSKVEFDLWCEYAANIDGAVRARLRDEAAQKAEASKKSDDGAEEPAEKTKLRIRATKLNKLLLLKVKPQQAKLGKKASKTKK
ncbi:hypothetical protein M885DRAFT_523940 [Pelagophyceae sp. CCMP2097]|nr:hypothetical protein M885DRAFT_523940 [Pelagophyceae sp. CCMP2097]